MYSRSLVYVLLQEESGEILLVFTVMVYFGSGQENRLVIKCIIPYLREALA